MTRKYFSLYVSVIVLLLVSTSCSMIRISKNRSSIKCARKNEKLIEECVSFAISMTLDKKITSFKVADIVDKSVRKDFELFGTKVTVTYQNGGYYEIPDSTVTISSTSLLMGITEYVYDFAAIQRDFKGSGSRISEYYFTKISSRLYYRKRPFPMM